MISQGQTGGVQAGEKQCATFPNYWNQAQNKKPGIVYAHGSGSDGDALASSTNWGEVDIMSRVSQFGYPMLSHMLGSQTNWGNQTSRDRIVACKNYGQANYGWKAGKCWLFGTSMGGFATLGEARDHPANYYGVILFIGAIDLAYIRDNNLGGTKAAIDTAWGLAAGDPLPVGANPPTSANITLPVQYWYVPDDFFTPIDKVQNMPNWCPNVQLKQIPGGSGHFESSVALAVAEDIRNFMLQYSN